MLERCSREIVRRCGGRAIPVENLHLTLAFLGEVEERHVADLMDLARGIAVSPFELMLDEIGYWPRHRLAWAGCQSLPPEGQLLLRSLMQSLAGRGFPVESRPFVPHVTLVRHTRCAEAALEHPIVWPISEFRLVESVLLPTGSHYRSLASWP